MEKKVGTQQPEDAEGYNLGRSFQEKAAPPLKAGATDPNIFSS